MINLIAINGDNYYHYVDDNKVLKDNTWIELNEEYEIIVEGLYDVVLENGIWINSNKIDICSPKTTEQKLEETNQMLTQIIINQL